MTDLELYYEMRNTIKKGDLEKMKQLINTYGLSYCPVWDDGYQLLAEACVQDHFHLAAYLLSINVKINSDCAQVSPLQAAALKNNTQLVKLLLEQGAEAYTNKNKAPIQIAIENKNFEIGKLLFHHNAVEKAIHELPDTPEGPMLHLAIRSGEYAVVKLLLDNGFKVNVNNSEGEKSIHVAISYRNLSIIKLLLDYGADINAKNREGITPLFMSLCILHQPRDYQYNYYLPAKEPTAHDTKILKLLLDYNADINIVDPFANLATLYLVHTYSREYFHYSFWKEHNLEKVEAIISHIVKLQRQNLYVSAGNLQELSSIEIDRFLKYRKKCEEELSQMVDEKIPNTIISLYNFVTKSDNYLASYAKNINTAGFVFSDRFVERFPIYASTARNCFSRGVRRKILLEESMQIFENNCPFASNLLSNCLVYIFKNLNNNDLHEFIWIFKQENR